MSIDNLPPNQFRRETETIGQIRELERINYELRQALKSPLKKEDAPGLFGFFS